MTYDPTKFDPELTRITKYWMDEVEELGIRQVNYRLLKLLNKAQ